MITRTGQLNASGWSDRLHPLLFGLTGLILGCGGAGETSRTPSGPGAPSTTPTTAPQIQADHDLPPDPARRPLGPPIEVELPPSVLPTYGERGALLVHEETLRHQCHVRWLLENGSVGPVLTVPRFVVGGTYAPQPLLISSDGDSLCFQTEAEEQCHRVDALLLAAESETLWLLAEGPATRSEPNHRRRRSAKHRPRSSQTPTQPDPIRIIARKVAAGQLEAQPDDTKLEFRPVMPAMGLIDAVGSDLGVQLLWYEHAPAQQVRGESVPQGKLRTGRLDRQGVLVPASRRTLFAGPRNYGFLEGHLSPRLFSRGQRVAYAGRFVREATKTTATTTGFESRGIQPWGARVDPAVVFLVDPSELASEPLQPPELQAFERIWAQRPALAIGQPDYELQHVAWVGDRGYCIVAGSLHSVSRQDGSIRPEPAPFIARRRRLVWAGFSPDGAGLARTEDGYAELGTDGRLETLRTPAGDLDGGEALTRHPDLSVPPPVRVGSSWWALRPAPGEGAAGYRVVRLVPSPAQADPNVVLHPDSSILVGGRQHGLLLHRRVAAKGQTQLLLSRFGPEGDWSALARLAVRLRVGFTAVERSAGGAFVAGIATEDPRKVVVIALDPFGVLLGRQEIAWGAPPGSLELSALPTGGAWLTDRARSRVVWLGEDARVQQSKTWPAADSGATCLDGTPTRLAIPTPIPGHFASPPSFARSGSCASTLPQWAPDGSLRWFGSTALGMDSFAEAGLVQLGAPMAGRSAAPTQPPASGATGRDQVGRSVCPPDMVSIRDSYCIDRFEVRLFDAQTGFALSPDYPPTPKLAQITYSRWVRGRLWAGDLHARATPLPPLLRPLDSVPQPVARSLGNVRPSGYLSGLTAEAACQAAHKRLCTPAEWLAACRGEQDRKFPYGAAYEDGACNVHQPYHPAALLHGNAAIGHLDPRLNRATVNGEALLRPTGTTERCASVWGDDRVFDMVGNLDEWVADKAGAFAGGFYARSTRSGCGALITAHPRRYLDYSLGARCCLSVTAWRRQPP